MPCWPWAKAIKVLYQNWEVAGGDECCPQTLAQIELVLVTRAKGVGARRIQALVSALGDRQHRLRRRPPRSGRCADAHSACRSWSRFL
jgi:hypothetical protein